MTITELGLRLPRESDVYDVNDFNANFTTLGSAIETLGGAIDALSARVGNGGGGVPVVSGIMTTNGAMNLGFQPSCVIVMARRMTGVQGSGTISTWQPWGNFIAMAIRGDMGNQDRSASDPSLTITAVGFTTVGLMGSILPHSSNSGRVEVSLPTAAAPLRYVAFR